MYRGDVKWEKFKAKIPEGQHTVWLTPRGYYEVLPEGGGSVPPARCREFINLGTFTGPMTAEIPQGCGVFISVATIEQENG